MLSPRSRREAIEQGRAELNRLYGQLPEAAYDLSLRDLVDQQNSRVSLSGGLPVEERQGGPSSSSSSPPDLVAFSSSSPREKNSRNNPFLPSPPRSPTRFGAKNSASSRPVAVPQVSPRRVSPRPTPPISPSRRPPPSIIPFSSKDQQVRPILPVFSLDGVNNRCTSCSAHVIFFKTRCLVCGRVYCNSCMKQGHNCLSHQTTPAATKSYGSSSSRRASCWPFAIGKHPREAHKMPNRDSSVHQTAPC